MGIKHGVALCLFGEFMNPTISIRNARLHNLKNVNLDIPRNKLVVLTGLSGSGKFTIAFDILVKESQRLRLAALLGSGLTGVLYVLDGPTIGLHPRDTHHLID